MFLHYHVVCAPLHSYHAVSQFLAFSNVPCLVVGAYLEPLWLSGLWMARLMFWWHQMCLKRALTSKSATLSWSLTCQRTTVHMFNQRGEHAFKTASTTYWCLSATGTHLVRSSAHTQTQSPQYRKWVQIENEFLSLYGTNFDVLSLYSQICNFTKHCILQVFSSPLWSLNEVVFLFTLIYEF